MKSKSIVQERLDAGKNRLDILVREVEYNRIPATELSKGLRQVGAYMESIQKMVKTDEMKFGQPINQKLESVMTRLTGIIDGLDKQTLTVKDLNSNLAQVGRIFESIQEYVDLEIETLA